MRPETADWLRKADGDWQVAWREVQSAEPVCDAVCFHAQQCAEKYLKAWLVEHGVQFPRTHDLVVLLNLVGDTLPQLRGEREALAALSTFAVASRYPGDDATLQEAREAIATAERARDLLRPRLGIGP